MIQGTGTNVGKSLFVAVLCRIAASHGVSVCPFKPQNMSNNAAVTHDGGEIGRAQFLQSQAARTQASVHMNPVLLKPESESASQIIVQGKVWGKARAKDFRRLKTQLLPKVLDSFDHLRAHYDLVVVEGAGSGAEANLQEGDIANMGFAERADIPVFLLGDIDRGGVLASVVGTAHLLSPAHRERIQGYFINKFRGDRSLFDDGLRIMSEKTGWPCLGLLPFIPQARDLPAEDSQDIDDAKAKRADDGTIRIGVVRLPRVANFDDVGPLEAEPSVALRWLLPEQPLPGDLDLVILPGSKAVRGDLAALRREGLDHELRAFVKRGGSILGLCGGYQMLGKTIDDPQGVEGEAGRSEGLGLLDVTTVLHPEKRVTLTEGEVVAQGYDKAAFRAYEIHKGRTNGPDCCRPFSTGPNRRPEGACSHDARVMGTYLHGLLANDRVRHKLLVRFGPSGEHLTRYDLWLDARIDKIANAMRPFIDTDFLARFLGTTG